MHPATEKLEDRILLSADMLFEAIDATPLTLQVAETELQIVDTNSPETVLASAVLSEITAGVTIVGNGYDVELTIDVSVPTILGGIFFDAGTGTNTLHGPGSDQTWNITGAGTGDLGGSAFVQFSGIEYLAGAADNQDTFIFEAGGSLDGVVDGGDGGFDVVQLEGTYDNVVYRITGPQSGEIELDDIKLTFDGMEPVLLNAIANTITVEGGSGDDTFTVRDINPDGQTADPNSSTIVNMEIVPASGERWQFVNPTVGLVINGLGGNDSVIIESVDSAFDADLTINAEHITFASTASINTTHDVTLNAVANAASAQSGTQTAEVLVDGSITTTGQVKLTAQVDNTIVTSAASTTTSSLAQSLVRTGATINAGTLVITAETNANLAVTTTPTAMETLSITSTQQTYAGIDSGATVVVGTSPIQMGVENASVLIKATDASDISTSMTPNFVGALTGFNVFQSNINLSRDTQAYIEGNDAGTDTLAGPSFGTTGIVKVLAENRNGSTGIDGVVVSNLWGQHTNTINKDDVLAFVKDATIDVASLEVTAENSTSYSADAKVVLNNVTGVTKAYIDNSTVESAPATNVEGVILTALDTSSYTALSGDFNLNLDVYPMVSFPSGITLSVASAINELNKTTQASLLIRMWTSPSVTSA